MTPMPTRNTIDGKPRPTPSICGTERRNPKLAPDAISMRLFGPGVMTVTKAKATSAVSNSSDMPHPYPAPPVACKGFQARSASRRPDPVRRDPARQAVTPDAHPASVAAFPRNMPFLGLADHDVDAIADHPDQDDPRQRNIGRL